MNEKGEMFLIVYRITAELDELFFFHICMYIGRLAAIHVIWYIDAEVRYDGVFSSMLYMIHPYLPTYYEL